MLNRTHTPLARCNLKFQDVGAVNADDNGIFAGYASVFGGIDSDRDTIMKGAFSDVVEAVKSGDERMPLMLYGHYQGDIVGKWLNIEEDEKGLWVEGEFTPNHTMAGDVYASLKHGALDGMSIGFMMDSSGYEELENGGRRITKIKKLPEISIVGFPADDAARVSQVKSSIDALKSIRDFEVFMRDACGLSRSMAKTLISQVRPMFQREADIERERKEELERNREWLQSLIK